MLAFAKGPMVWAAFAVFFGGMLLEGARFFLLTRKKERTSLPPAPRPPVKGKNKGKPTKEMFKRLIGSMDRRYDELRTSMVGTHPVMTGVTVVFHTFLFVTPLFLLAHNQLFHDAWGFSLPSFSDSTADLMTLVVLLCGAFFLSRRIFVSRVRAITEPYDYLILLVTFLPFVTGYLAYHQWLDYRAVLTAHILTGELMLMVIPFTKLGHMVFFFFYRLFIGSEYSFGQGRRVW